MMYSWQLMMCCDQLMINESSHFAPINTTYRVSIKLMPGYSTIFNIIYSFHNKILNYWISYEPGIYSVYIVLHYLALQYVCLVYNTLQGYMVLTVSLVKYHQYAHQFLYRKFERTI